MIKEVRMYTIKCDGEGCNEDIMDGSDYAALSDPDTIWDWCCDSDWKQIDGKDYCPKHWEWDADEIDPIVKVQVNKGNAAEG